MRRAFAAGALLAIVMVAGGCSSDDSGSPPAWSTPGGGRGGLSASTPDVCARIRTAIAADMTPLGKALGAMVGYGIANADDLRASARDDVVTRLTAIGTDITDAASTAADPALRTAAGSAAKNIDDLTADPVFLTGITSLADVTTVTDRLTAATRPIVAACGQ